MNFLSSMPDAAARRASLLDSARLWPEPSEAPDVPGEAILRDYLERGPARFEPAWLREQIEESPACQRALEELRLRLQEPPSRALDRFLAGSRFSAAQGAKPVPPMPPAREIATTPISLGEVRRTSGLVLMGESMRQRQTFRPLPVLIVEGPFHAGEREFWRGIPCTPAEAWPEEFFADDELLLRTTQGDYVAHLHAEHPIATAQIAGKLADAVEASFDALLVGRAALAEGLPFTHEPGVEEARRLIFGCRLDPTRDQRAMLARAQLHDCASWLSATLDAMLARDAWARSAFLRAGAHEANALCEESAVFNHLGLVAANDGVPRSRCLVWPGPLASFADTVRQAAKSDAEAAFWVESVTPPEPAEDEPLLCRASWCVEAARAHLRGKRFAVYCPSAARLIGEGTVLAQGAGLPLLAKLEAGLWRDFECRRVESLVLLIPETW